MMSNLILSILLLAGSALILIAAIGVVRMPDLMLRMHATSKAGALGGGLLAVASALFFAEADVVVRAISILVFVVMTSPIAAHAIARAGYFVGVPFWDQTLKDELRERLDTRDHTLRSGFEDDRRE